MAGNGSKVPCIKINYPYYISVINAYSIRSELKKLGFTYSDREWSIGILALFIRPEIIEKLEALGLDVSEIKKRISEENYINVVYKKIAEYIKQELPVTPIDAYFMFTRNIIELRLPRVDKETFKELKKKLRYNPISYVWYMKPPFDDWRKIAKPYARG